MAETPDTPPPVEFTLEPTGPSKRPEQLVTLLRQMVQREFPDVCDGIEVSHEPGSPTVSVRHLDLLDDEMAKALAHQARGVYNDFLISPWY